MNKIISSTCALALLAGCAEQGERVSTVTYRSEMYRDGRVGAYQAQARPRRVERVRRVAVRSVQPEQVEITRTEEAMANRRAAIRRQERAAAFEAQAYSGTAPAKPSGQVSTSIPPATEPAVMMAPEPVMPPAGPSGPQPVAERVGLLPTATRVAERPGYVISPYSPGSGYIDVTGLPPGSEARDPYTGKIFRVP